MVDFNPISIRKYGCVSSLRQEVMLVIEALFGKDLLWNVSSLS